MPVQYKKTDSPAPVYGDLKKAFTSPKNELGPYIYIQLSTSPEQFNIKQRITAYKKAGCRGIILAPDVDGAPAEDISAAQEKITLSLSDIKQPEKPRLSVLSYTEPIREALKAAADNSMTVILADDDAYMRDYAAGNLDDACRILVDYEYECVGGEKFMHSLNTDGVTMSVVAVNIDKFETLDLRRYVTDNKIEWDVPIGNWTVHQYVCVPDPDGGINMLDRAASENYIRATFKRICDEVTTDELNESLIGIMYRDVGFGGKNRRAWCEGFNESFRKMFNYDPAPYYPALFSDIGENTDHYKAHFTNCRTKLLADGYIRALADFTSSREMVSTGYVVEGKTTACSWLFGDAIELHHCATIPVATMPNAYMYGLNAIKPAVASASAANRATVGADMFRDYIFVHPGTDVIYRETMAAFARGVNLIFAHLGKNGVTIGDSDDASPAFSLLVTKKNEETEYCEYISRSRALLRGGRRVCDMAVLYPIHSLQSNVYLYDAPELKTFEYPPVCTDDDYMTLINTLIGCVGADVDLLHPDTLVSRCYSEDGSLFLRSDDMFAQYKVLFMPGCSMISLAALRVIAKYFDDGGKIIATVRLPDRAFEYEPGSSHDDEVKALIRHIFNVDTDDRSTVKNYYKNENSNGGIAYFLLSTQTGADGTDMVTNPILSSAIKSMKLARDVVMPGKPELELTGMLNHPKPIFVKIGLASRLEKCGFISYVHKKYAGCDICFIANTRNDDYSGPMLIKGRHTPEEWNPHTGKIRKLQYEYVRHNDEIYTLISVTLPSASSVFIVSDESRTHAELARDLTLPKDAERLAEYIMYDDLNANDK